MYKCSCQSCGEHLEYPTDYEGTTVACPHCGQGTELHQPKLPATQAVTTNAPPPMAAEPEEARTTGAMFHWSMLVELIHLLLVAPRRRH